MTKVITETSFSSIVVGATSMCVDGEKFPALEGFFTAFKSYREDLEKLLEAKAEAIKDIEDKFKRDDIAAKEKLSRYLKQENTDE